MAEPTSDNKATRLEKSRRTADESKRNRALYDAESRATDEKTARLKALRLARDAAAPVVVKEPPKKKAAQPRATVRAKSGAK